LLRILASSVLLLALAGCIRLNASHCGNQAGNQTCTERDAGAPFCNTCTAQNDGCSDITPPTGCGMGAGDVSSSSNATTDDDSSSTSLTGRETSSTAGTTQGSEPSSSSDTVASSSGEDETGDLPMCGNGEVEPEGGEECEDGVPIEDDCSLFNPESSVELRCYPNCTYDSTGCFPADTCDGTKVDPGEQCDGGIMPITSCAAYDPDSFDGGELSCDNCRYDTSGCDTCAGEGDFCLLLVGCCGDLQCGGIGLLACG